MEILSRSNKCMRPKCLDGSHVSNSSQYREVPLLHKALIEHIFLVYVLYFSFLKKAHCGTKK